MVHNGIEYGDMQVWRCVGMGYGACEGISMGHKGMGMCSMGYGMEAMYCLERHTCRCWTTVVRSYNMPAYTNQPRVHHTLAYPPLYTVCMCVCAMYLGCVYKL